MGSYNLGKPEDRVRMRKDHADELAAIKNGSWPRDINDYMRYVGGRKMAAKVCRSVIEYLDNLEVRINRGDLDLLGYRKSA